MLNRERQAVEERILRAAVAEVESWPEGAPPPPRLRRRRRGLARGRDRDRRLAPGRALRPPGRPDRRHGRRLEGLGALDARVRPARRARRVLRASRALRRPPRRGGPHDPARSASSAFARGVRGARRRGADRRPTCARGSPSTRSSRERSSASQLCEELARLAPFGLGNPGVTLLVDGCELTELSTVGDGKHLRFRVSAERPRRRLRDRVRPRRPARPPPPARPLRRRLPPAGEPLERHRLAAARRAPGLRRRASATRSCARWLKDEWGRGEAALDAGGARDLRRARARRRCRQAAATEPARVELRSAACSTSRRRSRPRRRLMALDDLSLEVEAGEILGVLGPNGAGKTTAIRVLTTVIAPTHGSFAVAGVPHTRGSESGASSAYCRRAPATRSS